jgi:hypothetical protein
MTQHRNRSFFDLLFSPLRKAGNHDGETDETANEEYRRKLEQRIEMALGEPVEADERPSALNSAA